MAKIDLYTQTWCELVFVNKNKEYGAYEMRMLSGRRHLLAILIVFATVALALVLPAIIESVIPKRIIKDIEATVLSDILIEQIKPKEDLMKDFVPPPPPLKSSIRFTAPVIKKDEDVSDEEEMKTQEELIESTVTISIATVEGTDDDDAVLIADLDTRDKEIVEENNSEKPYQFVEQMPEFPGGEDELRKYLQKNIVYPAIAQENGIKGTVYLSFVVSPDGSLSKVQVVRGIDKSCDDEALRVVNKMPPWKPGRQNGKAVYVKFTIPIKFELRNN
jgi:protein TonB